MIDSVKNNQIALTLPKQHPANQIESFPLVRLAVILARNLKPVIRSIKRNTKCNIAQMWNISTWLGCLHKPPPPPPPQRKQFRYILAVKRVHNQLCQSLSPFPPTHTSHPSYPLVCVYSAKMQKTY